MSKPVYGIVLAAGLSSRMGSAKQLLPFGEQTVLQTVVSVLLDSDLAGIHVVLGHLAGDIAASLAGKPVVCVENSRYREGMLSSVQAGVLSLPEGAQAAMLVLGDQPQLQVGDVAAVLKGYRDSGKGIVIPVSAGRRGHPIILDLGLYRSDIFDADPEKGLKPIVRSHPNDTLEVDVADEAVLRDIDTPEDYQRELGQMKADGP